MEIKGTQSVPINASILFLNGSKIVRPKMGSREIVIWTNLVNGSIFVMEPSRVIKRLEKGKCFSHRWKKKSPIFFFSNTYYPHTLIPLHFFCSWKRKERLSTNIAYSKNVQDIAWVQLKSLHLYMDQIITATHRAESIVLLLLTMDCALNSSSSSLIISSSIAHSWSWLVAMLIPSQELITWSLE